jgi:hypothetical protein
MEEPASDSPTDSGDAGPSARALDGVLGLNFSHNYLFVELANGDSRRA